MTRSRLLLNLAVGIALAVILAGLCCVIVVERCERNVVTVEQMGQEDFEPGAHSAMNDRRLP
jgi:hypothetical protein